MKTVEVKTADLIGAALYWAVATVEGMNPEPYFFQHGKRWVIQVLCDGYNPERKVYWFEPSTDWSQGGPLIERERISLTGPGCMGAAEPGKTWSAYIDTGSFGGGQSFFGPSPLIAACRAIVAAKLGDTVQVPEELLP